jgi:hypothetical protein
MARRAALVSLQYDVPNRLKTRRSFRDHPGWRSDRIRLIVASPSDLVYGAEALRLLAAAGFVNVHAHSDFKLSRPPMTNQLHRAGPETHVKRTGDGMTDRIRLLLADDHAHFRAGIAPAAHRNRRGSGGRSGNRGRTVEHATTLQPDVILMDVNMRA